MNLLVCAFEPNDIQVMSMALEGVCKALSIPASATADREIIAGRIIEFARRGERSFTQLCDRVLNEPFCAAQGSDRQAQYLG